MNPRLSSLLLFLAFFSFLSAASPLISENPAVASPLPPLGELEKLVGFHHPFIDPSLSAVAEQFPPAQSFPSLNQNFSSPSVFSLPGAFIARWLTVISYAETDLILGWNCSICSEAAIASFVPYYLIEDSGTGTLAFVGELASEQRIFVVFRGSANLANWLLDAEFWKTDKPLDGIPNAFTASGFFKCFEALRPGVFQAVLAMKKKFPSYTVTIIGHSLGGAIATITALDFSYNAKLPVENYSFGSPRVGDSGFSKAFEQSASQYWRMTHMDDPVPHLPLVAMGFEHVSHEVWQFDPKASYIICNWTLGEDQKCADSEVDWLQKLDIPMHTTYMNITNIYSFKGENRLFSSYEKRRKNALNDYSLF